MTEPESTTQLLINPAATNPDEVHLINEVGTLWQAHEQAQTTIKKSRGEMKVIRADLSQRLYELKSVLSRPGRGGAWSSFLVTEKIPRSSADRLVRGHERTLIPQAVNCAAEQIPESTEVIVHKYLHALWPRMSRVLTNPESIELFIDELRSRAGKSCAEDAQSEAGAKAGRAMANQYEGQR